MRLVKHTISTQCNQQQSVVSPLPPPTTAIKLSTWNISFRHVYTPSLSHTYPHAEAFSLSIMHRRKLFLLPRLQIILYLSTKYQHQKCCSAIWAPFYELKMSILRKTIVFLVYNALTDYCLRRIQMPAFSISLKGTTEQTTFGHQTNGHSWQSYKRSWIIIYYSRLVKSHHIFGLLLQEKLLQKTFKIRPNLVTLVRFMQ